MKVKVFCSLLLVAIFTTSCFGFPFKAAIAEDETGVIMQDGTSITSVVSAGRYRSGFFDMFAEMIQIDNSARQYTWSGTDLWTKDKQPLDFIITVTYHRSRDAAIIKQLWGTYKSVFTNDMALDSMVASRIPESAKKMTVQNVLEGILGIKEGTGGRDGSQSFMFTDLSKEFLTFGVVCDNVTIETVTASEEYTAGLQIKANSQLAVEISKQDTIKLEQQLKQEEVTTLIKLEEANRLNSVAEVRAKVYEVSDRAYELEKLRIKAEMVSDKAQVYVVDDLSKLNLFIDSGNIVPVD